MPAALPSTGEPSGSPQHLVLLAGVGGLSAPEALAAAVSVTPRVSVLFVSAWTDSAPLRALWMDEVPGGGEFLEVPDLDSATDACTALHERLPVHGVVTYSELLLRPQAQITRRLGLPGNSPGSVVIAQSKARQRAVFAEHSVPSPRFAAVRREEDLAAAAAEVGLPAVFKPSLGAGSQGVRMVTSLAELTDVYGNARTAATPFIQEDDVFLLEEPMPVEGGDGSPFADYVSVESLLVDGKADHLAVSDRLRLCHGYVEEGLVVPSRLEEHVLASVTACADQAIRAVGLTHGPVHTEVALTPAGPRVIEVNARAGGPTPNMLRVAGEYDFAAEIARVALGRPPGPPPALTGTAWFRFVPIPEGAWRVVSQRTAAEAQQRFPELRRLALRFRPGQEASRDTTQHLASFTVWGANAAEARSTAAAVEDFLAITLEPADSEGPGRSGQ